MARESGQKWRNISQVDISGLRHLVWRTLLSLVSKGCVHGIMIWFDAGRTDAQCRERYTNVLDPLVKTSHWTSEVFYCLSTARLTCLDCNYNYNISLYFFTCVVSFSWPVFDVGDAGRCQVNAASGETRHQVVPDRTGDAKKD